MREIEIERKLALAARDRDRAAFDELVRLHRPRLRAFLAARVGPDAAEDVLQETLLAVWVALPRITLRTRFIAWVLTIAKCKVADHRRYAWRRQTNETTVQPLEMDAMIGTHIETTRIENRDYAHALFGSLNDNERQVMELYYFSELTLPEIASRLDRNLNTVKYHFYRAHTVARRSHC